MHSLWLKCGGIGIHVSSDEILRLRAVAEKAARANQSIIFLPCHRSHVDYVSLQLICYRLGLTLPTVVAGDNLNFPFLGPFLQHAGAMWIRRSFGDDALYVTLVQAYIDTLLKRGFNFECFIEGGRSRMGKLLPPKFGILGFLLDSVLSGRVDDAIVCPVSTQYDKVIEVDSYISELLGQPKPKENLRDFLSASSVLSLKLGRVDVRFHEPWSLRGFIDQQQSRFNSLSHSQQADLNRQYNSNLRIRLLRTLGYKVLADINAVSVVMPTSLIGTVLLTLRGRGVGKNELIQRVEWLSKKVRSHGGRVAHFAGQPTAAVVSRSLEVLGPDLVGIQKGLVEDTYFAADRFQLSFYRNMLIHLFINQAIVSASIYTTIKVSHSLTDQSVSYTDLLSRTSFLSQLFRGEFIFPTAGLEANLAQTITSLENDGMVQVARSDTSQSSPSFDSIQLSSTERAGGRNTFDFYCFLIWPFIEATWLGAISLLMLTPISSSSALTSDSSLWLDDKAVQSRAQLLGKTLFAQGDLSYFEAVNKETLRNAYQRFEEDGIIQVRKNTTKIPTSATLQGRATSASDAAKKLPPATLVRLAPEWTPARDPQTGRLKPQGRLWDFSEEISKSRLEGKHRRDGDAVIGRVLRLVDTVARELWEEEESAVVDLAMANPAEGNISDDLGDVKANNETAKQKKKRRRAPLQERARI